ncbi:MAG: hypothetical protein EA357_10925 [Micavibrio sp.]|nr:MAG: hypothetical protein EA357_10925 [Micavibrio sp.]
MRFLPILAILALVFWPVSQNAAAQQLRDMRAPPGYDPSERHQVDPRLLPPGYTPPEDGLTDSMLNRLQRREEAQRVTMKCSSEIVFTAFRTTEMRDNKYHPTARDNEYIIVLEGNYRTPTTGYEHKITLENVRRDTAQVRLTIIPPAEGVPVMQMNAPLFFNSRFPIGNNPVTRVIIAVDKNFEQGPSQITCRG